MAKKKQVSDTDPLGLLFNLQPLSGRRIWCLASTFSCWTCWG